ncbi:MAG: hypothetical protein ACXVLQ_17120 [Bacteriovorax sp.]
MNKLRLLMTILFFSFPYLANSSENQESLRPNNADALKTAEWEDDTTSSSNRDKIFEQSEIHSELAGWDELARDLLWVRAKRDTKDQLFQQYPQISKKKLDTLSNLIKEGSVK